MPEKSVSEKVNHYKAESRTWRARFKNLEKRVKVLEDKLAKFKQTFPDEPLDFGTPPHRKKDKKKEDFRRKFLAEHYPNKGEE